MRDDFQTAVDQRRRNEADQFLCDVGADEETALRMIDISIPSGDGETPAV